MNVSDIKLVAFPNPILKTKALSVEPEEMESMKIVSEKMIAIMDSEKGIGLAGPQANISKRIIVLKNDNRNVTMINPTVLTSEGNTMIEEGCLSLKGVRIKIRRSAGVTVKYLDLSGKENTIEANGLFAICIQHEIDHLDGIMFTDRSGPMKDLHLKKYFKENRR